MTLRGQDREGSVQAPGQESCLEQQCSNCPCGGHHPICKEPLCPMFRAGDSATITGHRTAVSVSVLTSQVQRIHLYPTLKSKRNSQHGSAGVMKVER